MLQKTESPENGPSLIHKKINSHMGSNMFQNYLTIEISKMDLTPCPHLKLTTKNCNKYLTGCSKIHCSTPKPFLRKRNAQQCCTSNVLSKQKSYENEVSDSNKTSDLDTNKNQIHDLARSQHRVHPEYFPFPSHYKMTHNMPDHSPESDNVCVGNASMTPQKSFKPVISSSESGSNTDYDEYSNNSTDTESDSSSEHQPVNKKRRSYESNKVIRQEVEFLKKLYVPDSSEGGKYYKKQNCCPYCHKIFWRLDRHILCMHQDKKTVQQIKNLPPGTSQRERRNFFRLLRMHGNAEYNRNPTINKKGKLIVSRRLQRKGRKTIYNDEPEITVEDFIPENKEETSSNKDTTIYDEMRSLQFEKAEPKKTSRLTKKRLERVKCIHCLQYVSRRNISSQKKIYHSKQNNNSKPIKYILTESRKNSDFVHPLACKRLKEEIFPNLRENDVFEVIQ